jgi:DNA-binding NarL/FixJ family response regulator
LAKATSTAGGTIAVLADDLMWASRLVAAVERTGAQAARLSTQEQLETVLLAASEAEAEPGRETTAAGGGQPRLLGVVVDLGGRRYDGTAAVARAVAARQRVIAVAQHDDQPTRKRALEAGALRVFSYAKLFTDGPQVIERWLAAEGPLERRA